MLTEDGEGGIIEERGRHYIKGEHGYFMGSVSDGKPKGSASGIGGSDGGGTTDNMLTKETENKCEIIDKKINSFCLLPGAKHAEDFFDVGYKPGDTDLLRNDMSNAFDYKKAVDKKISSDNVEKFSIFMDLGVSQKKRFRTVWQKDTPESIPRLITAHRED